MMKVWLPQFLPFYLGRGAKIYEVNHNGNYYQVTDKNSSEFQAMSFRELASMIAEKNLIYVQIGHDEFTREAQHSVLRIEQYLKDVDDTLLYGVKSKQIYQWQAGKLLLDGEVLNRLPNDRFIVSPLNNIIENGWIDTSTCSDRTVAKIAKYGAFTIIGGILGWTARNFKKN